MRLRAAQVIVVADEGRIQGGCIQKFYKHGYYWKELVKKRAKMSRGDANHVTSPLLALK